MTIRLAAHPVDPAKKISMKEKSPVQIVRPILMCSYSSFCFSIFLKISDTTNKRSGTRILLNQRSSAFIGGMKKELDNEVEKTPIA
ncbi:MAG: hypothetical protein AAF492_01025 [Verrucomicrobiota bacterium]